MMNMKDELKKIGPMGERVLAMAMISVAIRVCMTEKDIDEMEEELKKLKSNMNESEKESVIKIIEMFNEAYVAKIIKAYRGL